MLILMYNQGNIMEQTPMAIKNQKKPVPANRLQRVIESLLAKLGPDTVDARRLLEIQRLFDAGGTVNFAKCLQALYPTVVKRQEAQDAFRKFRQIVNNAGGEAIRFECDTNLKSPPEQRSCWFESEPDDFAERTEDFSRDAIIGLRDDVVPPRIEQPWRDVTVFVSYAHQNGELVEEFIALLKQQAAPVGPYRLTFLADHGAVSSGAGIPSGEPWHQWIQDSISRCDLGLLVLSPAFLGSAYIRQHEIPRFRDDKKPYIPVILQKLSQRHDLLGLGAIQYFAYQPNPGAPGTPYFDCGEKERFHFTQQLYERMLSRLDAIAWPQVPEAMEEPVAEANDDLMLLRFAESRAPKEPQGAFVPPDATESSLAIELGKKRRSQSGSETERGVPALGYLKDWACTPYDPLKRNPPFFALLGEYGVGKTTCLKELTRQLLDDRAVKPGMPLPLLFDLRNVTVDKGVDAPVPTLEQILQTALNDWKRGTTIANLTPERILQAVQDEGALSSSMGWTRSSCT